jgi:DNA modification methylase
MGSNKKNFKSNGVELRLADSFTTIPCLPAANFSLILCDPPYGMTKHAWDDQVNLTILWEQFDRLLDRGGRIIWFTAHPFTARLLASIPESWLYYEIIWQKTIGSNQLNTSWRPLQKHENIIICYRKGETRSGYYDPQFTSGKEYRKLRSANGGGYGKQIEHSAINPGVRHPTTVLMAKNSRIRGEHPNAKPVDLYQTLIKQYCSEGGRILDPFLGSGNSALAAVLTGRQLVGIELTLDSFNLAIHKVSDIK